MGENYHFKNEDIYPDLRFRKMSKNKKIFSSTKILLFILSLIFISLILIFKKKNTIKNENTNDNINEKIIYDTKVCICTPIKKENRYIKDYIEHYKKYGVDKIFIYDNNDVDGERVEEVIEEYIKKGFVEIFDYRGKITPLLNIMNDCYKRNYQIYDWLIFFEVDEHIYLSNYTNVNYIYKEMCLKIVKKSI